MCEHGTTVDVTVTIPAELSHTGQARKKTCAIDACIAPLVAALEAGGVLMRGSCCGHGVRAGEILLADGRALVVEGNGLSVRQFSHGLVADAGSVCSPPIPQHDV